jgi:hypothetical protein
MDVMTLRMSIELTGATIRLGTALPRVILDSASTRTYLRTTDKRSSSYLFTSTPTTMPRTTIFNSEEESLLYDGGSKLISLLTLPVELLLGLFQYLDATSLASLCRVCRSLNHMVCPSVLIEVALLDLSRAIFLSE